MVLEYPVTGNKNLLNADFFKYGYEVKFSFNFSNIRIKLWKIILIKNLKPPLHLVWWTDFLLFCREGCSRIGGG